MTPGKIIPNRGLYKLCCLHAYNHTESDPDYLPKTGTGDPVSPPTPFIYVALSRGTTTPHPNDTGPELEIDNTLSSTYARKKATQKIIEQGEEYVYSAYIEYEARFEPGEIIAINDPNNATIVINGIALMDALTGGDPYFIEVRNPMSFDPTVGAIIKIRCTFARAPEPPVE